MAHIEERKQRNGKVSFRAEIVVRIDGKKKKKSRTFSTRSVASNWAKQQEKLIKQNGTSSIFEAKPKEVTVADAIGLFLDRNKKGMGKTKRQVLNFVRDGRSAFSEVKLSDLTSSDVRSFADELASADRDPATVNSYLSHVCHVLRFAEADFGSDYHIRDGAILGGRDSAHRAGVSGKSNTRDRRPTLSEIDALMVYFMRRSKADKRCVPMHLVMAFAIFGCRRQSEIIGIQWNDLAGDELLVRGTKHPRRPEGIDLNTKVTDEANRVIAIHGKRDEYRIFPYSADVVSRLFTNACKLLEIEGLHFHDLRHEGISWLRECGWSTSHVMLVSGHSTTQMMDRYSNLKQIGNKYEAWPWWAIMEENS